LPHQVTLLERRDVAQAAEAGALTTEVIRRVASHNDFHSA
jgi:hypothetical protein